MNFVSTLRVKALTAAIMVSAVSVNAQADINPGLGTAGSSSGELFLSVWDQTQLKSYSLDLGVTVDSLLSNTKAALAAVSPSNSLSLGSSFASMYQSGDTLSFNMVAENKYEGVHSPNYGIIVSHNTDALQSLPGLSQATVQTDGTRIGNWAITLNTAADVYNGIPVSTGAYGLNLSEVSTFGATGADGNSSYYATSGNWGNTLNGIIGNGSATATDTATTTQALQIAFYGDLGTGVHLNTPEFLGNSLIFSLNAASNTLTWTSAVPLPGALWLFLSAGLSLVGLQRTKRLG